MFLSEAITEIVHNYRTKPAKMHSGLTTEFMGKSLSAGHGRNGLSHMASIVMMFANDLAPIADNIKKAMRFNIDDNVADAIQKMAKTPSDTLLKGFKFAKPPYPITWIEYAPSDNSGRIGWLFEDKKDHIIVSKVMSYPDSNHTPMFEKTSQTFIISEKGIRFANEKYHELMGGFMQERTIPQDGQRLDSYSADAALCILLLMNSRSPILQVSEDENDYSKINKGRRAKGVPEKMPVNAIRFDLSRILNKNENMSDEEAARTMATSLVRGHFKIRQTGVFFWSPYVRNAVWEEAKEQAMIDGLSRDRLVGNSGSLNLILPGKDGPPM